MLNQSFIEVFENEGGRVTISVGMKQCPQSVIIENVSIPYEDLRVVISALTTLLDESEG